MWCFSILHVVLGKAGGELDLEGDAGNEGAVGVGLMDGYLGLCCCCGVYSEGVVDRLVLLELQIPQHPSLLHLPEELTRQQLTT